MKPEYLFSNSHENSFRASLGVLSDTPEDRTRGKHSHTLRSAFGSIRDTRDCQRFTWATSFQLIWWRVCVIFLMILRNTGRRYSRTRNIQKVHIKIHVCFSSWCLNATCISVVTKSYMKRVLLCWLLTNPTTARLAVYRWHVHTTHTWVSIYLLRYVYRHAHVDICEMKLHVPSP